MSENTEIVQEEVLDEVVDEVTDFEPEPGPTPEQEEEWERERIAAWNALIQPYRDLKTQISEHDDLMADALYEITMLELGMEV